MFDYAYRTRQLADGNEHLNEMRVYVARHSDDVYRQLFSYLSEIAQCLGGFETDCGSKERAKPPGLWKSGLPVRTLNYSTLTISSKWNSTSPSQRRGHDCCLHFVQQHVSVSECYLES